MNDTSPNAIDIRGVRKSYGSLQALKGVEFSVARGEFFGLLGPNGAGKSTLINTIAGLISPDAGSVAVLGHDTVKQYRLARRKLGVVPQELVFDPFFKVIDMLRIQAGYYGSGKEVWPWIDEMLVRLDLDDKRNVSMRALSGGMKRRVLIAQALVHKPPVVILDEPTAGVDVELRRTLWHFMTDLHRQGQTVVLTTHYLEEAQEMADRVGVINQGKLLLVDDKAAIMAKLGSTEARIALSQPLAELPPALADYPLSLENDGRVLVYRGGDGSGKGKREAAEVIRTLVTQNIAFEEIDTRESSLEDIFVDLVERGEVAA